MSDTGVIPPELAQHIQLILYVGFGLSIAFTITVCFPYLAKHFWHNLGGPALIIGACAMFGLSLWKQVEIDFEKGTVQLAELNEKLKAAEEKTLV